jgi:hypothetical protein
MRLEFCIGLRLRRRETEVAEVRFIGLRLLLLRRCVLPAGRQRRVREFDGSQQRRPGRRITGRLRECNERNQEKRGKNNEAFL